MKKQIVSSILSVVFIATIFFPMTVLAKEKILKLASWGPAQHYVADARNNWVNEVNDAVKGSLKIIDYPGGQLYGPGQMHISVAKGSIDMGVILQPAMLALVPMLQGVYLPFAFDNLDQVAAAYSGESLEIIEKAMEKKNIKLVYISFIDGAQIFSSQKNITAIEDLKGLRVLATSPIVTQIFAKLGAVPDTSIPQTEQYLVLKRGLSDAVVNSTIGGYFQKSYEVAPFITKMDMSFPTILVCMNLVKWNKLSKETQKLMVDLGKKQSMITLATAKRLEKVLTGKMIKENVTVTRMPEVERNKIKEVSKAMWVKWAQKHGKTAQRLLQINSNL